ncbi:D-amino acid aminotransferase [Sulfuriflexus sp.]|uniref:D-amino acid aminotransferase n=1 Tax=Sulfuriflexus sp. TaxID=2015443 RepID=UPI0028CF61A7|nr:D-amino acid aminotransferase [Sulfuriflexus sp.]MDT8404378.1 D-amino acid aminotransferase [Sulfuriflexus sp.]
MAIVYLNGEYLPAEEAKVSVLDRGFVFADGVYEVIPAYGGHLLRLEQHLQRLDDSLEGIRLARPLDHGQWAEVLAELIRRNRDNQNDLSIYLQVTRGVARRDHVFPETIKQTVFAMATPMAPVPAEQLENGVAAITHDDIRWRYCHIKSIALLPNILMRQVAREAGAAEAILHRAEQVTEGAASNVFIVHDGHILTPRKDECLLPGVTRDLVLEIAADAGLDCEEADISMSMLREATEIWVTSSTREILPVTRLDGLPVGNGKPGPVWRDMLDRYQVYKDKLRQGAVR